jgi:hypothetical protein
MKKEMSINLGFIGHRAESLQSLFGEYLKEPNQYGYFLRFENYSELVCNEGVYCQTNCFESEQQFNEKLNQKLLNYFLINSKKN